MSLQWYVIGLDDSQFSPSLHPQPGWVLIEMCAEKCNLQAWDPVDGVTPASCLTYSRSNCPDDRCLWGIEADLPSSYMDDTVLPQTNGNTLAACVPKKFCTVGCEARAPTSVTWRYITSMYLVFGSLEPVYMTLPERTFALFAYVVMVIIDGSVAGVLASVMVRMGGKDQEVNDRLSAAKNWMREQRIPKAQAAKALEYFRLVYRSRVMYEEGDILNTMPPAMKIEFSTQLYEKFLRNIPMFRGEFASNLVAACD